MTKFDDAFNYVIDNEKGLNTDPTDRGGITNWGISERFIESLMDDDLLPVHVSDEMYSFYRIFRGQKMYPSIAEYIKDLTPELSKQIYQKYFWLPIYDQIENQDICNYIFDMTVQHGGSKAAEITQRAINAYKWSRFYIIIDGIIGNETISEINRCDYMKLIPFMIAIRESLFLCIVAHDKTQEKFLDGWLKRCYR